MLLKVIVIGECWLLMLTAISLSGCSKRSEPKAAGNSMGSKAATTEGESVKSITKAKAIELAQQALKKTGENLDDYKVVVEDDPAGKQWIISFDKKYSTGATRPPGGGFWATVDKSTGKVFLRAGD